MTEPRVSIIIPHFNGREILYRCLESLGETKYKNKEVIIVNNASTDGSVDNILDSFPQAQVVTNAANLGYAGGCNSGLAKAGGKYVVFLNNDTTQEPNWLSSLVQECEQDDMIAACQPKILCIHDKTSFDYAGAAGGLMDVFGYPFARGRLFFTLEKDEGQYDTGGDIFWASGTATLIRRSVLDKIGYLDEDFFAHMEEIDLNWRMHLAGFRVVAVPPAIVYHNAGSTLRPNSAKKVYFNHRNSLVMVLKNYKLATLLWVLPLRLALEFVTMFYAIIRLDFVRLKGAGFALAYVFLNALKIWAKRAEVAAIRTLTDAEVLKKMYRGSIVFEYFVRGVRRTRDLRLL